MCCLFGIIDYKHSLTRKQINNVVSVLSVASEVRGTDATGIAYNSNGHLSIYKRPTAAHKMRFKIPSGVTAVMGHTRMTTQGDEKFNYNNHPFYGYAGAPFALAHNGVICNDDALRVCERLPRSYIKTDSYVAIQLLEKSGNVDFGSLRYMAEQLDDSFTITVMDAADNSIMETARYFNSRPLAGGDVTGLYTGNTPSYISILAPARGATLTIRCFLT